MFILICLAGSTDGRIYVWNTETGARVAALNADHTGPVQCVQFNPKYMMLASACNNMVSRQIILHAVPWCRENFPKPDPRYLSFQLSRLIHSFTSRMKKMKNRFT